MKYGYRWRTDLTAEEVTLVLETLAKARSAFHGYALAMDLAIDDGAPLNLPGMRSAFQVHNKTLSNLLEKLSTGYGPKDGGS